MMFLVIPAAFLVAISILVAVHEFGHYWVAKKLGFKVLRFSIGFGKPLLTRAGKDADRPEYCLAAIPLGGYVRLLDEREGDVAPAELHRSFTRRPISHRIAVLLAAPARARDCAPAIACSPWMGSPLPIRARSVRSWGRRRIATFRSKSSAAV